MYLFFFRLKSARYTLSAFFALNFSKPSTIRIRDFFFKISFVLFRLKINLSSNKSSDLNFANILKKFIFSSSSNLLELP